MLENIDKKKILVWHEQGLGDTIQFSRYVDELISLGPIITFEVQSELKSFMSRQFNCIITEDTGSEIYDFQIPLLSLPYLFYKSDKYIPKITNFLEPNIKKIDEWKSNLSLSKEKIGVISQRLKYVDIKAGQVFPYLLFQHLSSMLFLQCLYVPNYNRL